MGAGVSGVGGLVEGMIKFRCHYEDADESEFRERRGALVLVGSWEGEGRVEESRDGEGD